MKTEVALGLALAIAGNAGAQGMTEAAARERQRREAVKAAEWQEFQNPGGDFKVLFPYSPLKKREPVPGITTVMDTYVAAKDKRSYLVRVGQMEAALAKRPADVSLDELRAGLLKDANVEQFEEEKKISLGRHTGRQYRLRTKLKTGEDVVMTIKSFVAGDRILLVLSGALAEDKDTAIADRFFSSFAILR